MVFFLLTAIGEWHISIHFKIWRSTFDNRWRLSLLILALALKDWCLIDTKLVGGKAREYLNSLQSHVNAMTAYFQDKNGLSERHLQTLIAMARNWLASAELLECVTTFLPRLRIIPWQHLLNWLTKLSQIFVLSLNFSVTQRYWRSLRLKVFPWLLLVNVQIQMEFNFIIQQMVLLNHYWL